ncbi:MAG: methionyl-tRNA formyltransferase [Bryobacteraceae bacterium]
MRVVFLGTPDFAVPSLDALVAAQHSVLGVFTQPDRPKGRGQQMAESPVKQAASRLGIPVFQPERIRRPDSFEQLRSLQAELMVVVGYGQIIPQSIIELPPLGILNVHASLLPKYRGAAPIQWAIANGERTTGVTIMQIDAGLDTGDMLAKATTIIGAEETAPELSVRLAEMGARLLVETVEEIRSGKAKREKQDDSEATLAPILKKEDGRIDWTTSARQINDRRRGFTPWPGAYTTFRGQPLSFIRTEPTEETPLAPGLIRIESKKLLVGTGDRPLAVTEVQPGGKKRMSAEAFINGYKPQSGERMGDEG